jgi:iron-sulfur cluster assembly protein
MVTITENAAKKITELAGQEPAGEAEVLRIAIEGGGCSGFQYALGFDHGVQDGDHTIDAHGVKVVVDPFSGPYLAGATVDFVEGFDGGFAIDNPNVEAACGCGSSFQAKDDVDGEPVPAGAPPCGSGCGPA